MSDDVVTDLRRVHRPWTQSGEGCRDCGTNTKCDAQLAADEIDRLRALTGELLPFMLNDVKNGLWLGPPPEGHDDDCIDCEWYRESLAMKARIDAGEFGEVSLD